MFCTKAAKGNSASCGAGNPDQKWPEKWDLRIFPPTLGFGMWIRCAAQQRSGRVKNAFSAVRVFSCLILEWRGSPGFRCDSLQLAGWRGKKNRGRAGESRNPHCTGVFEVCSGSATKARGKQSSSANFRSGCREFHTCSLHRLKKLQVLSSSPPIFKSYFFQRTFFLLAKIRASK
jgi:hypothetical protein